MNYLHDLQTLLKPADCLLLVPPFWDIDMPCLGVHILQAQAAERGHRVEILYANILFARYIGLDNYIQLCMSIDMKMIGERFFAGSAHGLPPMGHNREDLFDYSHILGNDKATEYGNTCMFPELSRTIGPDDFIELESKVAVWVEELGVALSGLDYPIIGSSTSYDQNNATRALFDRIKKNNPDIITIVGGANCRGTLAEGLCTIDPDSQCIDYIFQDESERPFVDFLDSYKKGSLPPGRIIKGRRIENLDMLSHHHFDDYFNQIDYYFADEEDLKKSVWLPLETSRGCWWGVKNQCSFCGLTDTNYGFRQKSAERALQEIKSLLEKYSVNQLTTTDIIMPYSYFKTLLPQLQELNDKPGIVYEQKADLTVKQVSDLRDAGIVSVLAGIESFCSDLLTLMNKGTRGWQNLNTLRYSRAANIDIMWNILWGFPNDSIDSYKKMLDIIPLIHHLQPPSAVIHLSLNRYSPYFENPDAYEISNVKPLNNYNDIYPQHVNAETIAYQFTGDYNCGSHENHDVIRDLINAVDVWQQRWRQPDAAPPMLNINKLGDKYMLIDTRKVHNHPEIQIITEDEVNYALSMHEFSENDMQKWALDNKLGIILDDLYVPFVTSSPEIIEYVEKENNMSDIVKRHKA